MEPPTVRRSASGLLNGIVPPTPTRSTSSTDIAVNFCALPPVSAYNLAGCVEYHQNNRRDMKLPAPFEARAQSGVGSQSERRRQYETHRKESVPANVADDRHKQIFAGFMARHMPLVIVGSQAVAHMLHCDHKERFDAARFATGRSVSDLGALNNHSLPRRTSVHLLIPAPSVGAFDARLLLDAFTAVSTVSSLTTTGANTAKTTQHKLPAYAMRFTLSTGIDARFVQDSYMKYAKDCASRDALCQHNDPRWVLLLLAWTTTDTFQTIVTATRIDASRFVTNVASCANDMRQCIVCLASTSGCPVPVVLTCPPIYFDVPFDFYRIQMERAGNAFEELCRADDVMPSGVFSSVEQLESTGIYARLTPMVPAKAECEARSKALAEHCSVDKLISEINCSPHFLPGVLLCRKGMINQAKDFCTQPDHLRTRLPDIHGVHQGMIGLTVATLATVVRDVSEHVSLYGSIGIPGAPIMDGNHTYIGMIQRQYLTYDSHLYTSCCVQPCTTNDLRPPCETHPLRRAAVHCLNLLDKFVLETRACGASPYSPHDRGASPFSANDLGSMVEDYGIAQWQTNIHSMPVNTPDPLAYSMHTGTFFGVTNVSKKTSLGDAVVRFHLANVNDASMKDLLISLAANYGIGTSVEECVRRLGRLLGTVGKSAIQDLYKRKRSMSIATGAIEVASQSQKRRSPVFFGNDIQTKSINIKDVLRALEMQRSDLSEVVPSYKKCDDHQRLGVYLRAIIAAFHKVSAQQQYEIQQLHQSAIGRGDGKSNVVSSATTLLIDEMQLLSKQTDFVRDCLGECTALPPEPAMTIALIYGLCMRSGIEFTSDSCFVIVDALRTCTFHRIGTDATLSETTLDAIMMSRPRRLIVTSSALGARDQITDIWVPVKC